MSDKPTEFQLAFARAVLAAHGEIIIPKELMAEIVAVLKSGKATKAEIELIDESLRACPGVAAWVSQQLLAAALRGNSTKKAMV